MADSEQVDLNAALSTFDRVAVTLDRLASVADRLVDASKLTTTSQREFERLSRAYHHLAAALPAIDGFRVDVVPASFDTLVQWHYDAQEVGEPAAILDWERAAEAPSAAVDEYRFHFDVQRRHLVRERADELSREVDDLLSTVEIDRGECWAAWPDDHGSWSQLEGRIRELHRLTATFAPLAPWNDILRHLRFAEAVDLFDICEKDWPAIRQSLELSLYAEDEPLPVDVEDLADLVRSRPAGQVSAELDWGQLTPGEFERLIFDLVRQSDSYEDADLSMTTHAPDRSRDVQAYRIHRDGLGKTKRLRVIFQCKHWQSKSVGGSDLAQCIEMVKLWDHPRVDVLVVATTGRFSQDALAIAERREESGELPAVELWPDTHLETLMARYPAIATTYGLR